MAGVKADLARALAAIIGAAAVAAFSCTDPGSFLKAVNVEAKSSLDMYLEVTGVTPDRNATEVNPSSEIKIGFDRALDLSTITAQNITIAPSDSVSAMSWGYAFDPALNRLTLKPAGLEGGKEYIVTIGMGLRGSKGEPMQSAQNWSISTSNLPGGSMWINVIAAPPGGEIQAAAYTKTQAVSLYVKGNSLVDVYRASENPDDLNGTMTSPPDWTDIDFSLDDSFQGEHTVWMIFKNLSSGNLSTLVSDTIIFDSIPPGNPYNYSVAATSTHAPTWTWSSGGDGNGTYAYRLETYPAGTVAGSGTVQTASYTPSGIADGFYRIFVKELDEATNESSETHSAVADVDGPPNPPTVTCASPTLDQTPTWTWTHDATYGGGTGSFRYAIDPGQFTFWASTSALSHTPSSNLSDGEHVLNVQEKDDHEVWSATGSRTIVVTPYIPYSGQTRVGIRPTFSWRTPLGVVGHLELKTGRVWAEEASLAAEADNYALTYDLAETTTYSWRIRTGSGKALAYYPSENGVPFTTFR
jgi:hypothetical protein